MFNMQKMMQQAQKMQAKMNEIQAELETMEVTGTAGGGAVTVVCTGKYEFKSVKITQDALEDRETLEDLVLSALNDATQKINEETQRKLESVKAGLNIPGLNLPGF